MHTSSCKLRVRISNDILRQSSLSTACGQLSAAVAAYVVSKMDPSLWRRAVYAEWFFLGTFLIFSLLLPESPRTYARKGKHDKAKKSLLYINGHVAGYNVESEYGVLSYEIQAHNSLSQMQANTSWADVFKFPNLVSCHFHLWLNPKAETMFSAACISPGCRSAHR